MEVDPAGRAVETPAARLRWHRAEGALNIEQTMNDRTSRLALLILLLNIMLVLFGAMTVAWGPAARRPLAPAEGPHLFPDLAQVEVSSSPRS